ncbi:fic family toxin-antitoxin system, toxin component [Streptomyces sp. MNP-20]|uniref:fic family toxin-antitoxin system, toxin component n=1 Tax=Streptomyces sp. MNP-20 TaxID=2721165 RepID=UPI001554093F|nr:fic family toxin-antitoxin system, toxin component [Streptomyces sp. MNP-20]
MELSVELPWLLEVARQRLPGDPEVVDWGALEGARARHCFKVMDTSVYAEPHHRAAALLHSLVRVPALEHSNEMYAMAVALAFLEASGIAVQVKADQAVALAQQVASGALDVRQTASTLRTWIS